LQTQTQIQQQTRLPGYLRKCLKPQTDEDDVHAKFAKLLTDLNKADAPYSLSLANRLYGDRSYTFLEEFLKGTKKHYNAELESVDFKGNAEEARVHINSWVEKQTQGKHNVTLNDLHCKSLGSVVLCSVETLLPDCPPSTLFSVSSSSSLISIHSCEKQIFPIGDSAGSGRVTEADIELSVFLYNIKVPEGVAPSTTEDSTFLSSCLDDRFPTLCSYAMQFIIHVISNKCSNKSQTTAHHKLRLTRTNCVVTFALHPNPLNGWNKTMTELFEIILRLNTKNISLVSPIFQNDTKPVKMMQQKSKFPFATIPEANCKILEMPYKGNDLSMLIFLPNDIEDDTTGLEKLEKELTYQNFVDWTRPDMMSPNEVDVKLPRFKMEEKYDLEKILTNMGMENAFDIYKRDFSGMSPANDLIVSKVVHKALVDVNEEGTEAAAATGVDMEVCSITIPAEFVADHPFIFFIRHKPTKSILFVGRYCSPE
ncbi:leukocyte elastase inhibitor-like, partial [Simochromis diagramma]|uniref:leukocyte elastase inhibitor-like n=1 Tax=Simochromis diagramma TaxID=43689 RepID=UPI001A7E4573